MSHSRLLRGFAGLVAGFGFPRYGELSPTLFVAISSLAMFGMMFGDVGHGAVLMACGAIALLAKRFARGRDIGILLLLGGLVSSFFGVVYGSYFGIEALKHFAIWRDPLEGDPVALMGVAISIGIVVISLGLVLNIINQLRQKHLVAAIMDKFGIAGLVFYWGGLVLLWNFGRLRESGLATAALVAFVALPLLSWILCHPIEHALAGHGRKGASSEGWLDVCAESFVGTFEGVLVFLANTVSFVRLAAYAMSHAALLMATFLLADAVRGDSAWRTILAVLIIIAGNVGAIILEGVIASVQTVRLEYYEFFSKFFSGEGRPFTPFRLVGGTGAT